MISPPGANDVSILASMCSETSLNIDAVLNILVANVPEASAATKQWRAWVFDWFDTVLMFKMNR